MADWRDVMASRTEADNYNRDAQSGRESEAEAIALAILAVRSELRALGQLIDYATAKHTAATGRL